MEWLKGNAVKILSTPAPSGHQQGQVFDATAAVIERAMRTDPKQFRDRGGDKSKPKAKAAAAAAPEKKRGGPPRRVFRRNKSSKRQNKRANNTCCPYAPRPAQRQFLRHLLRYDKLLEKERFDIKTHECESCYDEKPGRSGLMSAPHPASHFSIKKRAMS